MNKQIEKINKAKQKLELFITFLRRFWIMVIIVGIVGGTLGGVVSRVAYTPEYTITQAFTIKLYDHPETNDTAIIESQLSETLPSLLSSETFMDYMYPYIKDADAIGKFKVSSLSSTNIFYLTVTARTNKKCIKLSELIQEHYNDLARFVIGESEMEFFTEPAKSLLPSNAPNFTTITFLGALGGLLLALLIIALKALLTTVISTSDEAEEITKSKCLAVFSTNKLKKRSNDNDKAKYKMPLVTSNDAELDFLQSVATLTSNVTAICSEKNYKSILFTSTISGEGKSSISINLALSLAQKGNKIALIDADLRTPSVADYLGIETVNATLSSVIYNEESLENALTKVDDGLYLLGDIDHADNAFEEATSKSFEEIIKELEGEFDFVIIDAAPVGILGEAITIAETVDAFIYVISHNYINKKALLRGLSSLDNSSAKMLGNVINYKK